MEESTASFRQLAATSKHFARRLLTIGENRLELLTVEVQEESERLPPKDIRSWWTVVGYRIHWPAKPCPTHLAGGPRFLKVACSLEIAYPTDAKTCP